MSPSEFNQFLCGSTRPPQPAVPCAFLTQSVRKVCGCRGQTVRIHAALRGGLASGSKSRSRRGRRSDRRGVQGAHPPAGEDRANCGVLFGSIQRPDTGVQRGRERRPPPDTATTAALPASAVKPETIPADRYTLMSCQTRPVPRDRSRFLSISPGFGGHDAAVDVLQPGPDHRWLSPGHTRGQQ